MLLRKVSQLEAGMQVRLQLPSDDVETVCGVGDVIPNGGPFGRTTVRFYRDGEEGSRGYNLFPDDMIEILL